MTVVQGSLFDVAGRSAVITGAASGIGRVMALALIEAGANVLCVDRDELPLGSLKAEVANAGGRCKIVVADISSEADVASLVDQATWSASVDILINNAGVASKPARLLDVSVAEWDRVLAVNVRSVFLCSKAFLPALLTSKHASIINISSTMGLVGAYPGFPTTAIPYGASKAAIIGFTRQLAAEYAPDQVRVNAIAPGWHGGTNLGRERRALSTPEDVARYEAYVLRSVPLGRRGVPSELAGLMLYLASDASRYVTGQVFAHDGGQTSV